MHINDDFAEVSKLLATYGRVDLVSAYKVDFDPRSDKVGFLKGVVRFIDDSEFHFAEYVEVRRETVRKLSYRYHYQGKAQKLVFRYDNAAHKPTLPYANHKHTTKGIQKAEGVEWEDVLLEILARLTP